VTDEELMQCDGRGAGPAGAAGRHVRVRPARSSPPGGRLPSGAGGPAGVPEDAEDVAQEAFLRAWSTLKRFRGEASFKTWLLTIAWNRAINHRRLRMNWWRRTAPLTDVLTLAASSDAPDDDLRSRELRTHIGRAIEALTPKLRDALLLAQSGEYAYDEIGAMLSIPQGTVKWRVSEARRRVRQRLAALGYVHE
jgi:RNA polymerase sigma-70 factor (ECF subfamily)